MELKYNAFLLRYHEIGTKGNNRKMFERKLAENVARLLIDLQKVKIKLQHGRLIVHLEKLINFSDDELNLCIIQLSKCFGLESFSPAIYFKPEMEKIEENVMNFFDVMYHKKIAEIADNERVILYRMRARRSDKKFPMDTKDLEIHFAEKILPKYPRLKIDLKNAEITIGLEVREKSAFAWFEQFSAPGGLPVGCSGSILTLLSGGIDSPVAAYSMMKRGAKCSFLTFHSYPYTPTMTVEKVAKIAKVLNTLQGKMPLFACNLSTAQKAIRDNCTEKFRTILYRRMMMRIASVLADFRKELALLTGESLGQVASQTLENMTVIDAVTTKLILRPLVGMDKSKAIEISKKIELFELSSIAVPDSCTIFAPGSPATSSKIPFILYEEEKLDLPFLMRECLKQISCVDINTAQEFPFDSFFEYVDTLENSQLYI